MWAGVTGRQEGQLTWEYSAPALGQGCVTLQSLPQHLFPCRHGAQCSGAETTPSPLVTLHLPCQQCGLICRSHSLYLPR